MHQSWSQWNKGFKMSTSLLTVATESGVILAWTSPRIFKAECEYDGYSIEKGILSVWFIWNCLLLYIDVISNKRYDSYLLYLCLILPFFSVNLIILIYRGDHLLTWFNWDGTCKQLHVLCGMYLIIHALTPMAIKLNRRWFFCTSNDIHCLTLV